MNFAPPTIYFCPACNKSIIKTNYKSYTVQSSTLYSDGYRTGYPRFTPNLAKCPNCQAVFFLHNLWAKNENVPYEEYKYYKNIETPNTDDYIKAVKKELAKTVDEEIELRTCLLHSLNDTIRYSRKQNGRDTEEENKFINSENFAQWETNCEALLSLLEQKLAEINSVINGVVNDADGDSDGDSDSGDGGSIVEDAVQNAAELSSVIAELHRNLGHFDTCFDILESLPETYEWLKLKYMSINASRDRMVFILMSEDENAEDLQTKDYDLNDPDQAIEYFTEKIENRVFALDSCYYSRAEAYFKKGDLKTALDDVNAALAVMCNREEYYSLRADIYEKLGDSETAEWNLFRAKHVRAFQKIINETDQSEIQKDEHTGVNIKPLIGEKSLIEEKPLIATEECSLQIKGGNFLFVLSARDNEPIEPEILYSGGDNALFRRRPDQFILIELTQGDVIMSGGREEMLKKKEVIVAESMSANAPSPVRRGYAVKIRPVFETLESVESIVEDGYPLFTSLRARVCANRNKPISVLVREDRVNLAAVLVREENYMLLDKYFAEKLPVNERVSSVFKTWQPTPLFYATAYKTAGSMKDPVKMLRYLAANQADPDMPGGEGDTPLGNQCFENGQYVIMKTLIEIGADPDGITKTRNGPMKPLHLLLLPSEYDDETQKYRPVNAEHLEKVKLLVDSGADVNYVDDSGLTALGLAISFSEGKVRNALVKLLLKKGADIVTAVESIKKSVEYDIPSAAFALYELYSGSIENIPVKSDSRQARKYLEIAAGYGYEPAIKALEDEGYSNGKYEGEI